MKRLITLWKSKTPKIWKMAQRLLIAIGSLSTASVLAPETFSLFPPYLSKTVMICAAIGAFLTQFKSHEDETKGS